MAKPNISPQALNDYQNKIADAAELFDKKEFSAAIAAYEEAASLNPEAAEPKEKISEIMQVIKDLEDAAASAQPSAPSGKGNSGVTLGKAGKADSSEMKATDIRALEDHECTVGKVRYAFSKNRSYTVPLDVAKTVIAAGVAVPK